MSDKSIADRQKMYETLWSVVTELKGAVDGWEFKNYVLGFMFYRYISENFADYVNQIERNAGDETFDYYGEEEQDEYWKEEHSEGFKEEKGYFIRPTHLFKNVLKRFSRSNDRENINKEMRDIFDEIESGSRDGLFANLFKQMDFTGNKLGDSGKAKGEKILDLLRVIQKMELRFEDLTQHKMDMFGDAYEYLIGMYASNAGKYGGEYFTPSEVSETLVKLVMVSKEGKKIKRVYDPTCGSGSLLLKFLKNEKLKDVSFYGQEINPTTHNLCRMNMLLHNVEYHKFDIQLGDTLLDDKFKHFQHKFDAIVSNPPYSVKWEGSDNATLVIDERFIKAGVLAPKDKADLAFVLHVLHHLEPSEGVAAIVCFPGILYRGRQEKQIREYLVSQNVIDSIIKMPENLFFGTNIETCVLVLNKNKQDRNVFFLDASEQFEKAKKGSRLTPENIEWIVNAYSKKEDVVGYSRLVDTEEIIEKDCNLSFNAYIEPKVEELNIDINVLEKEIEESSKRSFQLRTEINEWIRQLRN